jgi:hypothetical protein
VGRSGRERRGAGQVRGVGARRLIQHLLELTVACGEIGAALSLTDCRELLLNALQ